MSGAGIPSCATCASENVVFLVRHNHPDQSSEYHGASMTTPRSPRNRSNGRRATFNPTPAADPPRPDPAPIFEGDFEIEAELEEEVVAGIDVHASLFVACVLFPGHPRRSKRLQCNSARAVDLDAFVARLVGLAVRRVAIEATGVYWMRLQSKLAENGIDVLLANPQQVKAIAGRKHDAGDAKRLAHALKNGSLKPSFIASDEQRELRALTRGRVGFVRSRTAHKNRAHKILRSAGFPLNDVVDDVFCETLEPVLEALANGRTPDLTERALLAFEKETRRKIREALDGYQLTPASRLVLKLELASLKNADDAIRELDTAIRAWLAQRPLWQRTVQMLDTIPGIGEVGATTIVAECGHDLSRFPSPAHLASWCALCPGRNESAGKQRGKRAPKGNPYVRRTLIESAQTFGAPRSPTSVGYALHARLLRHASRMAWNKAVFALAHRLIELAWLVARTGRPYDEAICAGTLHHEEQRQEHRRASYLLRRGWRVTPPDRLATPTAR